MLEGDGATVCLFCRLAVLGSQVLITEMATVAPNKISIENQQSSIKYAEGQTLLPATKVVFVAFRIA